MEDLGGDKPASSTREETRTSKSMVLTTAQQADAQAPRTGRLVLVLAQRRSPEDCFETEPRPIRVLAVSKSRYVLPDLVEFQSPSTEGSSITRRSDCHFLAAEAGGYATAEIVNTGNFVHQSAEGRHREEVERQ